MGAFKNKSDSTFSSAELLLDNSHFNSCVHCFYYSCFQLIIDLLKEEYKYTDEQLKNGVSGVSSHNNIINELKKCLYDSEINIKFIREDFSKIKKKRIEADYLDKEISANDAKEVKRMAIKIREEINKIY